MTGLTIKELGMKIREKRKEVGMSQEVLASFLGVTKSTISKYELGLREPSFEQLQRISDAVGLGPFALVPESMQTAFLDGFNTLLHTDRYHNAATTEDAEDAEVDALDIFMYFNALDAFGQKRVIAYAQALAGYQPAEDDPPPHAIDLAIIALCNLNEEGQQKAVERVEELTEIPKYKKETPQD